MTYKIKILSLTLLSSIMMVGCSPKVQLEAPEKPITINLNVKVEHEVRVRVEKDLETLFKTNQELF